MKNASLIFNAVLLVLVGVLFYLHFSSKKEVKPRVESIQNKSAVAAADNGFRIGYFEWDSIMNKFELFKAFQNEVNQREEANEREKNRLRQQYQNKVNSYTQNAKKGMSQTDSELFTQEIRELEASISGKMQQMDQNLSDYTVRKQKELKSNIEEFLKDYTKTKQYAFVFAYEPGLIFYRDTVYNITSDLVKGLNANFPKKK